MAFFQDLKDSLYKRKLKRLRYCYGQHKSKDGKCYGQVGNDRSTDFLALECIDCPYHSFLGR